MRSGSRSRASVWARWRCAARSHSDRGYGWRRAHVLLGSAGRCCSWSARWWRAGRPSRRATSRRRCVTWCAAQVPGDVRRDAARPWRCSCRSCSSRRPRWRTGVAGRSGGLIGVIGVASVVGRLAIGALADRVRRVRMFQACSRSSRRALDLAGRRVWPGCWRSRLCSAPATAADRAAADRARGIIRRAGSRRPGRAGLHRRRDRRARRAAAGRRPGGLRQYRGDGRGPVRARRVLALLRCLGIAPPTHDGGGPTALSRTAAGRLLVSSLQRAGRGRRTSGARR